MNEPAETPTATPNKGSRKTLLIVVGLIVLCCICLVGAYVFYQYLGDPLLQYLGLQ